MIKNKRVIIAALISSKLDKEEFLNPIRKELIDNGNEIIVEIIQRRGVSRSRKVGGSKKLEAPINSKTILGSGKIQELKEEIQTKQPELVVFLNELKKNQKIVIEEIIGCRVEVIKSKIQ